MDASVLIGLGGESVAVPALRQGLHAVLGGQGEHLLLQLVVVLKTVVAPGGVEDPVAHVDQIQQTAKFLFTQFDVQNDPSLPRAAE